MIQHIINVSGGKDSEAVYTLAARKYGNRLGAWRAIMCDTGNEHPWTLDHVATMHERIGGPRVEIIRADFTRLMAGKRKFIAAKWPADLMADKPGAWEFAGLGDAPDLPAPADPDDPFAPTRIGEWRWTPAERGMSAEAAQAAVDRALAVLQPSGVPFLDLCKWKGRFPSRKAQFCTQELKRLAVQMQVVLPAMKAGDRVLQWIGVRRDESVSRKDTGLFSHQDMGELCWYPIRNWTADQVFAYLREQGVDPNPLYRHGMSRVGCFPCINCQKSELAEIAWRFPEHIERIAEWERLVTDASKRRSATFFAALTDPMDRGREGYAGIRTVIEWARTERGGAPIRLRSLGGGTAIRACVPIRLRSVRVVAP